MKSLSEPVAFNEEHANLELPPGQSIHYSLTLGSTNDATEHPGQDKLIKSEEEANRLSEEEYKRLDEKTTAAGGEHGIDKVLREHNVDVIIGPADSYVPDILALASRSLAIYPEQCA